MRNTAVFAGETGLVSEGCTLRGEVKRSLVETANWQNPGYGQDGNHPVVCVNWLEATAYAEWLSEKAGKSYRLPAFRGTGRSGGGRNHHRFLVGQQL